MAGRGEVVSEDRRGYSAVGWVGLAVQLIGWLFVLAAALQAFGAVVAAGFGLVLVTVGRRLQRP